MQPIQPTTPDVNAVAKAANRLRPQTLGTTRQELEKRQEQDNMREHAHTKIDPKELEKALTQLNANVAFMNARYSFQVDRNTEQLFVQVKDKEGKVIRQVPPEAILRISADISRMIGIFLDELA